MKLSSNRKRITISSLLLITLLLLIFLNYSAYKIGEGFNHIAFIISILTSIIACSLLAIQINTTDKVRIIYTLTSFIISILFSYIIIELLNQNTLFSIYRKRLLFNFIVIIFLHLFIYAISNKISLTIILSNSIIFILGIVNYAVTCFRGTPLVPWDVLSFKTATYVATTYTFQFSYYLLLSVSLFVLIIAIALKASYRFKKQNINLTLRFISIVIVFAFTILFYKTDVIDYFDFENNLWKPKDEYANNGFLASFVKQSKNLFSDAPENYSSDTVESILLELEDRIYQDESVSVYNSDNTDEDTPNIIVIMSESYSDLSVNRRF